MSRYEVVIYGASGFTGAYMVQRLVASKLYEGVSFAVAGRSETKLRQLLATVSNKTGKDINATPIIIADVSDEQSLAEMAKRAKVIVNAVGPYRLYGEAVVKAAVENGASHVDISGEPAFLEKMQMLYGEKAKEKGVYVVGACGWDSIPCDLGVKFLKEKFDGDLNHVETFVQMNSGPSGYAINTGTYQTLILGIGEAANDGLGKIRREIMPQRIAKGAVKPPKRGMLWHITEKELDGWALPFMGSDKSIVNRSQYYDAVVNGKRPSSGPTEQQIDEASFVYWFFGYGYSIRKPLEEQHDGKPDQRMVVKCRGPDAGYVATSGCALSAALALVHRENLPEGNTIQRSLRFGEFAFVRAKKKKKKGFSSDEGSLAETGGVFTTASAFARTNIYSYLKSFGIVFEVETPREAICANC